MMRCVWLSGLIVASQLVCATAANAQPGVARTVPIGIPPVMSPAVLGRPIAVTPRPTNGIVPAGHAQPANSPIAVTPVGLTTPQPWPSEVYDPNNGTEFATDRQVLIAPPTPTHTVIPVGGQFAPGEMASAPQVMQITRSAPSTAPLGGIPAKIAAMVLAPVPVPTSELVGTCSPGVTCPTGVPCATEVLPYEVVQGTDPKQCGTYLRAEYLLWWTNGYHVPPLATTSNPGDEGFLGRPSTRVLFGDSDITHGGLSGLRLSAGYWCDCEEGIEVSGFFLGSNTVSNQFRGTEFPVLTRPFFDGNQQVGQTVSLPGQFVGDLTINSPMSLWGVEANFRCNWCCWNSCECADQQRSYRVDMLFGPRYIDLTERLTIRENILGLASNSVPEFRDQQITVTDSFGTRNQFYGGQIGLDTEFRRGRWSLNARGKVGLGVTHQTVDIDGSQRLVSLANGAVQNFKGGLLALENRNIGTFTKDRFSVVPEITLTAGYNLLDHVRVFGGYNFLYWSNVVRPGDQIDTQLDTARIPNFNPAVPTNNGRPIVPFKTSDFWAHGLTFGVEIRY